MRESIVYKNKNGTIIKLENTRFGGTRYILLDATGNYVKDISLPFRVADHL